MALRRGLGVFSDLVLLRKRDFRLPLALGHLSANRFIVICSPGIGKSRPFAPQSEIGQNRRLGKIEDLAKSGIWQSPQSKTNYKLISALVYWHPRGIEPKGNPISDNSMTIYKSQSYMNQDNIYRVSRLLLSPMLTRDDNPDPDCS